MKYLQISTVMSYGSIGRIMRQNYDEKVKQGYECLIAYGRGEAVDGYNSLHIGTDLDVKLQGLATRLFDKHGYGSKLATKQFVKKMEEYNPDIIHLHNIHGYYINIEILFQWLKQHPEKQVYWTLHDCWSFTGHCVHFAMVKCDKWKEGCGRCVQRRCYPSSYLWDNSEENYKRKKKAFTGLPNMKLLVPSNWLKDLVKQSFLQEYEIEVVYNEVDNKVFRPVVSDFKKISHIENKIMILGVSNVWNEQKGLQDFIELSNRLDENIYKIVLVGLSEKQLKVLPKNVIGLTRTNCIEDLVKIYSAADIFVNPSKEETFGMTTVEAQLCGAKVIVYKDTAGEEIVKKFGGVAVEQSIDALYAEIMNGCIQ